MNILTNSVQGRVLLFFVIATCHTARGQGDELDAILNPSVVPFDERSGPITLYDENAAKIWDGVVSAFRKNDMQEALSLGRDFLEDKSITPTPFQLLGCKVMIGWATKGVHGMVFVDPKQKAQIAQLMAEQQKIWKEAANWQKTRASADSKINLITRNMKVPVTQGTANYFECVRAQAVMNQADTELETLKAKSDAIKQQLAELELQNLGTLKTETMDLLDMLVEANEIEAAFAIANVFVREVSNDRHIAKKQQDIIRLYKAHEKAQQVAKLLVRDVQPFIDEKNYWQARQKSDLFLENVAHRTSDADLLRMVKHEAHRSIGYQIANFIARGDREAKAIGAMAKIDRKKAKKQLASFKENYPDFPGYPSLMVTVASGGQLPFNPAPEPGNQLSADGSRFALVIGNGAYKGAPLLSSTNDANGMTQVLQSVGFDVITLHDVDQKTMLEALRTFARKLRNADVGLFYFSGHGLEHQGENYMDTLRAATSNKFDDNAVSLNLTLDLMHHAQPRVSIVILDCCRGESTRAATANQESGLAPVDPPGGTFIAFATAPGTSAYGGGHHEYSVYTRYLIEEIPKPGVPIESVFKNVRVRMASNSERDQLPWERSSLKVDFQFAQQ